MASPVTRKPPWNLTTTGHGFDDPDDDMFERIALGINTETEIGWSRMVLYVVLRMAKGEKTEGVGVGDVMMSTWLFSRLYVGGSVGENVMFVMSLEG